MVTNSFSRKARGRGLRTTTGCLVCRKRHLKCDETKPACRRCTATKKTCTYSVASTTVEASDTSVAQHTGEGGPVAQSQADPSDPIEIGLNTQPEVHDEPLQTSPQIGNLSDVQAVSLNISLQNGAAGPSFASPASHGTASVDQPVGVATARWLDMLAGDAQIDLDLNTVSGDAQSSSNAVQTTLDTFGSSRDGRISNLIDVTPSTGVLQTSYSQPIVGVEPWQNCGELALEPHEQSMFVTFVTHVSSWLDLFDPCRHFSALVPRLALCNIGLLNAIMALTIRFQTLATYHRLVEHSDALPYYHSTLQYVARAMQYPSYQTSDELLATALIISAYEMLDGSSRDWERHLQGVFWIQRAQVIHGDTGGFRGANWWTWLCQDIWAAFREKRRVFTFWKPQRALTELAPVQLAARSVFMLARVIDYCTNAAPEDESTELVTKIKTAEVLTSMLDDWRRLLTPEFRPIPQGSPRQSAVFSALWIHPPMFAVSMQVYHAARILILLNKPSLGGINHAVQQQAALYAHANVICGIALTLSDYGSSIMSSQCLFFAGLCTYDRLRRDEILRLLEECRARSGWPKIPLEDDLRKYWHVATPTL